MWLKQWWSCYYHVWNNMLFSPVKISCLSAKAHLVFHWCKTFDWLGNKGLPGIPLCKVCHLISIDQFRSIKIHPKTVDLSTRLWGINTEFVGFIPQSLVLRSIVLGWILLYRNCRLFKTSFISICVNKAHWLVRIWLSVEMEIHLCDLPFIFYAR